MDVVWIESEQEFREIAPEWDAALRRSGADDPFLLSDFLLTWMRHFKSSTRDLRIAAIFYDRQLIGGLPLYIEGQPGERILRFLGADDSAIANYTDLFTPGKVVDAVLDAFCRALQRREDWDLLILDRWYFPAVDIESLRERLESHGLLVIRQFQFPTLSIDVPDSLEEHLQNSGKKFRNNVRRAYRRAEKLGALSLKVYSGSEEIERLYARYLEISEASYAARGDKSTFTDSQLRFFFRDLLVKFDELEILDSYALRLDDKIIAVGFCYSLCNNLNYILTAFDIDYEDISPGQLLTAELLKAAIEKNAPVMNFYTGAAFHKKIWTNRTEPVFNLMIGRKTLGNMLRTKGREFYGALRSFKDKSAETRV